MFKTNCRCWHLVAKRVAVIVPAVFCSNMSSFYKRKDLKLVALSEVFAAERKSCYSCVPGTAHLTCFTDTRGFSFGGSKLKIGAPQNALMLLDPTPLALRH